MDKIFFAIGLFFICVLVTGIVLTPSETAQNFGQEKETKTKTTMTWKTPQSFQTSHSISKQSFSATPTKEELEELK